jgi:outer membrane lipoprotein SlyB
MTRPPQGVGGKAPKTKNKGAALGTEKEIIMADKELEITTNTYIFAGVGAVILGGLAAAALGGLQNTIAAGVVGALAGGCLGIFF